MKTSIFSVYTLFAGLFVLICRWSAVGINSLSVLIFRKAANQAINQD